MRNPFKKQPLRAVRLQHKDMDNYAIEGIWTGMVDGHYHLTAAKTVTEHQKLPTGDLFVHPSKVLFLEVISTDGAY